MRILLGHTDDKHPTSTYSGYDLWLERLRANGISVDGFCLTLDHQQANLLWPELDARWRRGDKELLGMYERLARRLEDYDVLVNFNGINLHPDFVRQLPTFNVYSCFDDPESSEVLSRPVAATYDLALVGNAAEVETYRSWGVKEARFWPLGFRADDYDPALTREQILNGKRDVDISLTCERVSSWRRERVDKFAAAFPQGKYYGKGWPNGFLPEDQRITLYQQTKIGINIHNSTGPINFRTYILPANGVMQICDNKSHLGKIFELGKEVAGFESIEEAIDLGRYYLDHDDERREIAAAGWDRAMRDYNELSVFKLLMNYVDQLRGPARESLNNPLSYVQHQRRTTAVRRALYRLKQAVERVAKGIRYVSAATGRRLSVAKEKVRA